MLATNDPAAQERLGTHVREFDQALWDLWKLNIVVYEGNRAKFAQNAGAGRQLRATEETMLVEANPRDWIWSVGRAIDDPLVTDPAHWRGTNFLGRILTRIKLELA